MQSSPSLSCESLKEMPLAFASCSIGSLPSDTLPRKLEAISSAGYKAIELSFPDIIDYGSRLLGRQIAERNWAEIITVAGEICKLCNALSLKIFMLQPFANFEGWPKESAKREDAFSRARAWIEVMNVVGTDMLQVGSTDASEDEITTDRDAIVSDLRELADMLAQRKMRLAYENWCWSSHAPTWKDAWEIVRAVDRTNIGLCLDTFQTAGGEWADPTTESGLIEDVSREQLDQRFAASLEELTKTVPADKIYVLQISDAYKPVKAIENRVINGLRPRERWSRDFRPMPYDGGYLPLESVVKAVLKTGFRGWLSTEIFDSGPEGKGRKYDVFNYAKQTIQSVQNLLRNLSTESEPK